MFFQMPGSSDVRISAWSRRDGVGHSHVRRGIEPEGARGFLAEERVVVDFGEALVHEKLAHLVLEVRARGWRAARTAGTSGACGRDGIVAHHAAHLFHQVVLDGNVLGGAPGRHGDARRRRAPALRRRTRGFPGCAAPRPARPARPSLRSSQSSGSRMRRRRRKLPLPVGHAAHQADAGRDLAQQLDGARQAANRVGRVLRLLEAHGGVGAQLDGGRGLADGGRLEIGALQHHAARVLG